MSSKTPSRASGPRRPRRQPPKPTRPNRTPTRRAAPGSSRCGVRPAPRRNATTLTALEAADDLLVVGTADPVGLQRLVRAVQDLSALRTPAARIVVNRVRASAVGARPERRIAEALQRFAGLEEPGLR